MRQYFVKEGHGYRICQEIRGMVVFATQNVIMDPPFTKLDILSCHASKLKQELRQAREDLRTTCEEMQSSQEELKSTNEELQSTNEKLTRSGNSDIGGRLKLA